MTKPAKSFLALSCVGFIATAPAYAAEPAANEPTAGTDQQDSERGEVIVEGERIRRDSNPKAVAPALDTPRSIVTIDKQIIKDTGSATLVEALRTVPGITFGAAEGGNPIGDRPFIRGFDSQGSTFLDGVRDVGAQSREVFAVEQIQVVRGSDSTLGGRGSAGGTLNIVSKLPQPGSFASGMISYGTDDYKRATVDLNGQIGERVSVRLNAMYHDQDVAGRDALYQKRWGIAPAVTIGLGTDTKLTAMYYHLDSDELPDSGFGYAYAASASINATPVGSTGTIYSEPAVGKFTTASGITGRIDPDNFYGLKSRDFRDTKVDQFMLRAEHDFGGIRLRNTARWGRTEQAYIFTQPDDSQGNIFGIPTNNRNVGTLPAVPALGIPAGQFNNYTAGGRVWRRANTRFGTTESMVDQLDLSGRFKTGSIEHSFAIGAEYGSERTERGTFVVNTGTNNGAAGLRCGTAPGVAPYNCADLFNPNPNDPWVNLVAGSTTAQTPITKIAPDQTTINHGTTKGVYAFDSITLIPELIVNLGIRYEDFRSRTELALTGGLRPQARRKDDFVTYQAGVVFKPTPETSLYASYATAATPPNSLVGEGSEGNGLTSVAAANDALKIERTKSYEIGAKADVLGGKLSLTAAAFRTETKNARVTSDANTVAFIGERRVDGVELGLNGNPTPWWTVFGGYTYLDAKIVDGGFTAFTLPAGTGAGLRTVLLPSVNTGKQFPQTAKHSFTMWTNVTPTTGFTIGGGAFYMSRVFGGYADNRYVSGTGAAAVVVPATVTIARSVPSYWRFDARAGYQFNQNLELSVNVQNLTDKRYFAQAFASHYATMAPGRSAFATLSFRY